MAPGILIYPDSNHNPSAISVSLRRCIKPGLESHIYGQKSSISRGRQMESGGNPSSYKYLRNLSCPKSSHLSNQKRVSHKPILRFQNNNSMSSEARFLETSSKTRDHNYSSKIFESKQNQNFIPIHSRKNKHFCGSSIQEEKPFSFGNRIESRHLQSPTSETSIQVDNRSIHKREKLQTLSICNLNPFKHSSFRCISSRLEPTRKHIHVSSSISHQQSDLQTKENSSNSPCSIDNTQQTTSTMVLHTSKNLSQQFSPTTRRQLFTNNDIKRLEILSSAPISLNRLVPITSRFSSLSSSLQHKISSTIRESSSSTYQQLWKKLALFISERYGENKFPYIAIIDYFESLIDSKYSVSSIPRSRSAFHIPLKYYFPEQDLLQDEIINLLIKFHQRQQPKQILEFPSWELDLVLKRLEDLDVSSYDHLLEKTLFLTLLAFPARISEFQALSISRSSINKEFMILQPRLSFTAKNHSHTFCPKPIKIPSLPTNIKLCPVYFMQQYLEKCSNLALSNEIDRPDFLWMDKNLNLLTTMKIRKLFQKTIYLADPNAFIKQTNIHSIRAVSASILELKGLNLLEILSTMNWTSPSTYIQFYSQHTKNSVLSAIVAGHRFRNDLYNPSSQ